MLLLLLPMVVWGSAFAVTKGLVELWPQFTVALVRVGVGTLVLLPVAIAGFITLWRSGRRPWTLWALAGSTVVVALLFAFLAALAVSRFRFRGRRWSGSCRSCGSGGCRRCRGP